jgi:Orsellinic acid/F9775 biosynthesis cluster protein D
MPTTAPTLDPALFPGIIQHRPKHRLLYCRPYSTVVLPRSLQQHLYGCHTLPQAQRKLLLQHCRSLDLTAQRRDLQLPPDASPALPSLPIEKGYSCCRCRYLTSSRKMARNHANKVHKLSLQACTDSYHSVQLQSWFLGSLARYWIVTASAGATGIPTDIQGHSSSSCVTASALDELYRLEQQEIQRLERLEEDCIAQEAELEDSDNSEWLRWNQWPTQFAGLPLDIIAASAVQPKKEALESDYKLGA